MVQQLAQLAADSLSILRDEKLIDDGIFEIIPYDEEEFTELGNRSQISFKPFYNVIEDKFQADTLLPAANGQCSSKSHSYWASDTELIELFSDKQLAQLIGVNDARWIFRSRGKKEVQNANKKLADYIDGGDARSWKKPNLIVSSLDPEAVLKRITSDFIAAQSQRWLHNFYRYLWERPSYQKFVKDKPIFLDQDGRAVPAFDDKEQLVLFLPDDDIQGYTTVKKELLSNTATREFIEKFGVKKPSLRDEIYNKILPTYDIDEDIDTSPHFMKFFRYFKECRNDEVKEFIGLIKDKAFLRYTTAENDDVFRGEPENIYLPTDELKAWFEPKPDTRFLLLDEYREMVGENEHERLDEFLEELGVARHPQILEVRRRREELPWQTLTWNGHSHEFYDNIIDGCEQLIAGIDEGRSVLLWQLLPRLIHDLGGRHTYSYYGNKFDPFESTEEHRLRSTQWILNGEGAFVSRHEVTVQSLSSEYDTNNEGKQRLIKFLRIRDETQDFAHLSADERHLIERGKRFEGVSDDEWNEFEEFRRRKRGPSFGDNNDIGQSERIDGSPVTDVPANNNDEIVPRDILDWRKKQRNELPPPSDPPKPPSLTDAVEDDDASTPAPVDYGRKIERAKLRSENELDDLLLKQELHDKAITLPRYSYGWFLALLELECMDSSDKNAGGKTISISFGKVERDVQSSRTIILKEPSRFIPQSIEEFSGVRVDLYFGNGRTGKLRVESFTAKEFSLLGKLESADDLNGIDLGKALEARIEIQNPSFLLQELLERVRELSLDEKFDMKANLTPEIEFVFGPPGTGKTTHLAENVLIPMMRGTEQARVLVLTPTNKAADVLTTRIIEKMSGDTSYLNWLVRFGTSSDERIDKAGVWRDRSFDIAALSRSVTVTTIARFAYDGFAGNHGKKLYEMKWDAIVFDEASMIPLASIIYPLYRQKPQKFIIAGDPFQIEPIVAVEQWKDENIYTLVGLNKAGSFAKPATEPHDYPITNLDMQYRSIPAIGEVFSGFTYDGILKHHRTGEAQRLLKLNGFDAKPLNLIKFPVGKYESIYRC